MKFRTYEHLIAEYEKLILREIPPFYSFSVSQYPFPDNSGVFATRSSLHPVPKKTDKNRTVRLNHELTSMHQEVIENLESIKGALLRMNRSIQAEGTFGIIKNDRWYKRIVRRGIKSVLLEVFLVSIGHNLYKYHNKQKKVATAA